MAEKRESDAGIRVVLDAMGGDFAPAETVAGAALAREQLGLEVILCGMREPIEEQVALLGTAPFEIVEASEAIGMADEGAWSVKAHPDSSLMRGAEYVREGKAGALVSAGNTGAAMSATFLSWGRIRGIKRPAVAVVLPPADAPKVLLDAGANADCRPEYLQQFALMGTAYWRILTGREDARVGLLNIGSEAGKGNELAKAAYGLLEADRRLYFSGNVEGRDLAGKGFDVVVTDGFTGNVAIKTIEGTAAFITGALASALGQLEREALEPVLPALARVKAELDYEEAGGALLLGVKGVCVIGHGSSRARAVAGALKVAAEAAAAGLTARIETLAGTG
jgi:glycerol-3-phosphate acyltransferase PlsX